MRKTHYKVVLDVYIHSDEGANIMSRLMESGFMIDPDQDGLDEMGDIQDIIVRDVEVIDSR